MALIILQSASLFLAGILAGEEFIVRYGVQPALRRLDERAHLLARIALVKRLKVVVPAVMMPTVLVVAASAIVGSLQVGVAHDGAILRWLAFAALVALLLFSFLGTVPINIRVNDWNADAPPAHWRALVLRWERIDVFRSSSAMLAFALLVASAAVTGIA